MLAQSCASVPPAPELIDIIAFLLSSLPESITVISKASIDFFNSVKEASISFKVSLSTSSSLYSSLISNCSINSSSRDL